MYLIIYDDCILKGKNLKQINKQIKSDLNDTDFKVIGEDKILKVSNKDYDFIRDIGRISNIPFDKLYKKDTSQKLILYLIILLNIINLLIK